MQSRNVPLLAAVPPPMRRLAGIGLLTATLWLAGVLSLFGAVGALFD